MARNRVLAIFAGLLLAAALWSAIAQCAPAQKAPATSSAAEGGDIPPLQDHAPIRINSDADPAWDEFPGRDISSLRINGTGKGYCIYIGNCTQDFTISQCDLKGPVFVAHPYFKGACIELFKAGNGTISQNAASGCDIGIFLFTSEGNAITGNTCSGANLTGIYLEYGNDNEIAGNTLQGCQVGVGLYSSAGNTISGNTASGGTDGVMLDASNENGIAGNTLQGNERGVYMQGYMGACNANTVAGNNISSNQYGVKMDWDVNSNTIENNDFYSNTQAGVYNEHSWGNEVSGNAMGSNNGSVIINDCDYTVITYNNFTDGDGPAVAIYASDFCRIHHNNFVGNNGTGTQASDTSGGNLWNDTDGGNYWSDWTGPDGDLDRIVDLPYNLSGGAKDHLPLADPVEDAGSRVPEIASPMSAVALTTGFVALFLTLAALRKRRHQ